MLKETFGKDKRWVNYKLENRDGKLQKIPYNEYKNKNASSTNEDDWYTYDEVKSKSENIGIVFTPDKKLIGIDIDKCIVDGEIQHEHIDLINTLIEKCNTYTEYSVSGTGLHLYLYTDESFDLLTNRKDIWEIYNVGRFFATVEKPYKEYNINIRHVTHDELNKLLSITGYPWGRNEDITSPVIKYQPSSLSDQEVLNIMFRSKNGKKIEQLYNTVGTNGSSEDDMSLCSHLAFYCDGYDQIERIWVSSPLGSRDKTIKRKDYREDTINKAMKSCKEHYKPSNRAIKTKEFEMNIEDQLLFTVDKNGNKTYILNTENICRILRNHTAYKGLIKYDEFKNTYEIFDHQIGSWRVIEDTEAVNIQTQISVLFPPFAKVGKEMVFDAMIKVAKENKYDSAIDFIRSVEWDKKDRLDTWLCSVYGVENDELHRAIGSNWIKGLVNRIVNPGCKFDYVLVIEGKQGSYKSTSLSTLVMMPKGYSGHLETTMSLDSKDFFMQMQGKLIIEFSEGETLSKSETKKMKAIITTTTDTFRPPYERLPRDFPRRCVYAMTTNESEYLKDATGNRRWLPVEIVNEKADIEWIKENRQQLFAEALYRLEKYNETTYEFPQDLLEAKQQERNIKYVHEDVVVDWYEGLDDDEKAEGVTIKQIYDSVIHSKLDAFTKEITNYDQSMISGVLMRLGLYKDRRMIGGKRAYRWYPKEVKQKVEEDDIKEEINKINF